MYFLLFSSFLLVSENLFRVPCCCIIKYASFFSLVALSQFSSNHSFLYRDTCLPRTSSATCCMVLLHRSHSSCIVSPPVQGDCFRHSSDLSTYIFVGILLNTSHYFPHVETIFIGHMHINYPLLVCGCWIHNCICAGSGCLILQSLH